MMFVADRASQKDDIKKIEGKNVILVATRIPRNSKKYKTVYIYHIEGTELIVFNRSRDGICFMKIAVKAANMKRFYETFVKPPITDAEKQWLELYDYRLVV